MGAWQGVCVWYASAKTAVGTKTAPGTADAEHGVRTNVLSICLIYGSTCRTTVRPGEGGGSCRYCKYYKQYKYDDDDDDEDRPKPRT